MISRSLNKPLAILLTGLSVMLFLILIIIPYLGMVTGKQDSISQLQNNLHRLEALQQKADLYGDALKNFDFEKTDRLLFHFQTPALASADLQGRFNGQAKDIGINGTAFRPLNPENDDLFIKFGFRVTFQANTYNLLQLLRSLEAHQELILIDNVKIQAQGSQAGPNPTLNIQMDIIGIMEVSDA